MFNNVYKKKQLCEDNGKDQTTYKKKPAKMSMFMYSNMFKCPFFTEESILYF